MSKTTKASDKLAAKRTAWLERTMLILGVDEPTALSSLRQERQQGARLNPLVAPTADTQPRLQALGWQGKPYSWTKDCYTIDEGSLQIRDSELVTSGAVYIQNAASWLPVIALDPQPGEDILDACAAPGGKASHIAAITNNQANLQVNDNSRPRLAKMRANLDRLRVSAEYSLYDATQLARRLEGGQFDKIMLDAPCSGEGLMHYDRDKDFASWSVAHIKRLQHLQKQIVLQAWRLLKPGGTLVYSTCTMAPEENEAVMDYLLRKQPEAVIEPLDIALPNRIPTVTGWNDRSYDPALQGCLRLAPSPTVEAFFVCKLKKLAVNDEPML